MNERVGGNEYEEKLHVSNPGEFICSVGKMFCNKKDSVEARISYMFAILLKDWKFPSM